LSLEISEIKTTQFNYTQREIANCTFSFFDEPFFILINVDKKHENNVNKLLCQITHAS